MKEMEQIWLQDVDVAEETTWCYMKINNDDVMYYRSDVVEALRLALLTVIEHWENGRSPDQAGSAYQKAKEALERFK